MGRPRKPKAEKKIEAANVIQPPKAEEPKADQKKEYESHPKFHKFKKGTN